ncbi:MAG: glycosyltransferase family 39 protein [Verrucomicrobiales bacterium]|nr:glycosyltransferase family 39 protein [Verrucomicrobiales bacterium]
MTVFLRSWALPLIIPDEGRNAEVAREMKETGAWLVPTYNGLPYLDKPAFYFKTVALSLAVFGDNEFAARLPSALFACALLALTGFVARREFGARTAVFAVLVTTTLPLFILQARIVIFDIALALFVCLSIFAGYLAETVEGPARRRWYWLGAAAAGVATLVKGPVGFLVPLLVLAVFHVVERRWDSLRRLLHPVHFLIVFAVVLPWFFGVTAHHPDFPEYGLVEESFKRFTTKQFRRTAPPYYYLLVLPATFLPWSLLLPAAGLAALRRWNTLPRLSRLCIVWSFTVVVFFSLSQSKLPGYILSVTVPFGILVAQLMERAFQQPEGTAAAMIRAAARFLALFTGTLAIIVAAGLVYLSTHPDLLPKPYRVLGADLEPFVPQLPFVLALLVSTAGILGYALRRRNVGGCAAGFALFPMLLLILGGGIFQEVFESRSAKRMAAQIGRIPEGTDLAFLDCFPTGLPFYLGKTGTLITRDGGELTSNYVIYALKRQAAWPPQAIPLGGFDDWIAARTRPVYLVFRANSRDIVDRLAAERGATVIPLRREFFGILLPPRRGS